MSFKKTASASFFAALALVFSLWPALYNGQPFFFPDTTAYVRGADAGISKLTHRKSVWTEALPTTGANVSHKPGGKRDDRAILAGRSVYYGAVLYAGSALAFWPTVLFQAALFLLAIGLTLFNLEAFSWPRLAALAALLAAATPVAFFNSFLMPDVFSGLAIMAAGNLLAFGRKMSGAQRALWLFILAVAVLFHFSNLIIAAALLVAAALWSLADRNAVSGKGALLILVAVIAGVGGEAVFDLGVAKLTGAAPIRPPFVMARLIADGPGYRYLKQNCAQPGFVVCTFLDRLPDSSSEDILWSHDAAKGIFEPATPEIKRVLSAEQYRFAAAVVAYEPLESAAAVAENVWSQLSSFGLATFNYPDFERAQFADKLPEPYRSRLAATPAAHEGMPVAALTSLVYAGVLAALLALVGSWALGRDARAGSRQLTAIFLAGLFLNAVVCGALSKPDPRYQARVIWLLPALVLMLEAQSYSRRRQSSHSPAVRLTLQA